MHEQSVKVLVVDDHALFRAGIAHLLNEQEDFEVVGEAQHGAEAVGRAKELMPDLILMDIYMPEMGGLEATRRIKGLLPSVKVVILTASEEDENIFEAVKAGAQGYLEKKIEPEPFLRLLREVMRGEALISSLTATKILGEFAHRAEREAEQFVPGEQLSPREEEVLALLAGGATNREIASSLGISDNTVKNHLRNILDKLHLKNRVQAATFASRKYPTHPPNL